MNSDEANIPKLCVSSTSENASVVATSPELSVDPMLALLDCNSTGVTSVLLTSTDFVQSIGQTVLRGVDRSGCPPAREREQKVRRAEVEEAGNQATMIARETWSVRMEMPVQRKTPKTVRAVKLEPHARKCLRVWNAHTPKHCWKLVVFRRVIYGPQLHWAFGAGTHGSDAKSISVVPGTLRMPVTGWGWFLSNSCLGESLSETALEQQALISRDFNWFCLCSHALLRQLFSLLNNHSPSPLRSL